MSPAPQQVAWTNQRSEIERLQHRLNNRNWKDLSDRCILWRAVADRLQFLVFKKEEPVFVPKFFYD